MRHSYRLPQPGWWHTFTDLELASQLSTYITLEAAATTITTYQNIRLPGLLQTARYARALLHTSPDFTADEVERHVAVRMGRQVALETGGPRLDIILDENVIRRLLGDSDMAEDQLGCLIGASKRPNTRIRIVPFDVGLYCGTDTGPFSILEFASVGDCVPEPPVVYVESGVGSAIYFETSNRLDRYRRSWGEIERVALNASQTRTRLTEIMKEILR